MTSNERDLLEAVRRYRAFISTLGDRIGLVNAELLDQSLTEEERIASARSILHGITTDGIKATDEVQAIIKRCGRRN